MAGVVCGLRVTTSKGERIISSAEVMWAKESGSGSVIRTSNNLSFGSVIECSESIASLLAQNAGPFIAFTNAANGLDYFFNALFTSYVTKNQDDNRATIYMSPGAGNFLTEESFTTIKSLFTSCSAAGGGGGTVAAIDVVVTPTGNLTSINAQAALEELQSDIDGIDGSETIVTAGTDITVTGSGTSGDPYVVGNGIAVIDDIGNVNAVAPNDGDALIYSTAFGEWIPSPAPSTVDTDGVEIVGDGSSGSPVTLGEQGATQQNEVLAWDGSKYTPKPISAGQGIAVAADASSIEVSIMYQENQIASVASVDGDGDNVTVRASYMGVSPTATIGGTNNSLITITVPEGCIRPEFDIKGFNEDTDGDGNITVVFEGAGIRGNESTSELKVPMFQKIQGNTSFNGGVPSATNSFPIDIDNNPAIRVVGVGTTGSPSVSVEIAGIDAYERYNISISKVN